MTDPARRRAARPFGIAAILLGAILLGSAGCGSVTAKKSDGGTGGSNVDSSTKMDVAADRKAEDAQTVDASSHGGSGGAGGSSGGAGGGSGGAGGSAAGAGGGGGGAGGNSGGAGGAGECQSDSDCVLYPPDIGNCCGTCQPKSEPEPGSVACLIACLTPLKSCSCVSHQCKGSVL